MLNDILVFGGHLVDVIGVVDDPVIIYIAVDIRRRRRHQQKDPGCQNRCQPQATLDSAQPVNACYQAPHFSLLAKFGHYGHWSDFTCPSGGRRAV